MTPNPYTPPRTEVAHPTGPYPPRPASVRNACFLILASMVLGLITLLPAVRGDRPDETPVPMFVTLGLIVFFSGLTVWLATKIYRGRNWARWAMLAFLVLGWCAAVYDLPDDFRYSPLSGFMNSICIAMEVVACWFLFFGQGAKWYAQIASILRG